MQIKYAANKSSTDPLRKNYNTQQAKYARRNYKNCRFYSKKLFFIAKTLLFAILHTHIVPFIWYSGVIFALRTSVLQRAVKRE